MFTRTSLFTFHVFIVCTLFSSGSCLSVPSNSSSLPTSTEDGRFSPVTEDNNIHSSITFQGWTPQPNGRGTIDIIWSCVFTIFLCCWSVLCLNLPAATDRYYKTMWRKFCLTGLGILGPEFILQTALGQYISARRSFREFQYFSKPEWPEWSMTHAFFADMGGFILHCPDFTPFPIDAKQLHYLVINDYLPFPKITKAQIKDRNKVDALLRVITVLQTLWFVLNCLARVAQHISITTFELTTIGFIFCTLGTYICWASKPADLEVPEILVCEKPLREILKEAGEMPGAGVPYGRTPLDFISRKEWSWSLWWSLILNIGRKVGVQFQPKVRPINRVPNDDWLEIPPAAVFTLGFVDMMYASIYIAGWNLKFATNIERTFWHVCTAVILGIVFSYLVIESYTFYLWPNLPQNVRHIFDQKKRPRAYTWLSDTTPKRIHHVLEWMRNSSPNKDPQLYIPLKASIPITVIGFIYFFARIYIILECLIALRKLPSYAYDTVNWSGFLPHV